MLGCRAAPRRLGDPVVDPWSTVVLREEELHTVLLVEPHLALLAQDWHLVLSELSQSERTRIDRLRRWPDQLNSAIGWHLLHRLADHDGTTVHRAVTGRPCAQPPFDVSLSHSDRWTGVALSRIGRIGIDIEAVRPVTTMLHRRCLGASELGWLHEVEPGMERDRRFFRLWTAKEAYLKALGVGLSVDPRDVEIDGSGRQPVLLGRAGADWDFTADFPAPGLCMTVCAEIAS